MSTRRIVKIVLAAGASGVALAQLLRMRTLFRARQTRSVKFGYRHVPTGRFRFPSSGTLYSPSVASVATAEAINAFKDLRRANRSSSLTLPITIYLSDESAHEQVEAAVEDLLASVNGHIEHRDDPILGSWFRRMRAKIDRTARSPLANEAKILAAHAAESRLVHAQDATVTATMMQNLGPVLTSLQPTKDAVIRAGALLIVKVDGIVMVHQLTAAQQLTLDHQPQLAWSPHDILAALELPVDSSTQPAEGLKSATGSMTSRSIEDNQDCVE